MSTSIFMALALATQAFSLPPGLLGSICFTESRHNPRAFHKDDGIENSVGLCQLHVSTAKMMGFKGKETGLYDPKVNAHYAGKYLAHQLKRYGGDTRKAVAAYNAGTYRTNPKGEIMNRKYVSKVFAQWAATN